MESKFLRVSAYVPCYNARETIRGAIGSILGQTVPAAEVFVIDDGSTDGSGSFGGAKVIRLDCNEGRGAARAKAMVEARHEFVLGCDATLILDRSFLEKALPWFRNDRIAGVFGRIRGGRAASVADRWRDRHLFQTCVTLEVRHHASLATGCCLLRKSAVEAVGGFSTAMRSGEDVDLGDRLLKAGFDVICDPHLQATSVVTDSVMEVLERYARWNTRKRMSALGYLRQLNYALKVMVAKDLKAGDPLGACFSLLAPHYQYWWSIVCK
jgi:glycosyltransferase involved in cell wall biosynthesis